MSLGADGRFEDTDGLWSMDVLTGEFEKVKAFEGRVDRHPRFSLDDNHLAFVRGEFVRGEPLDRSILILNRHSKLTRSLTRGDGDYNSPSWSPVGNRIAFSFRGDGSENSNIYVRDWTVDDSFGDSPQFVRDGGGDPIVPGTHIDDEPSWSPDGQWIAFTRLHVEGDYKDRRGIYVVSATEAGATPQPLLVESDLDFESPSWSSNSDDVSVDPVGCS